MFADEGNLLWIDLEMTGLDHTREGIIEIASVVTNQELEVVAEGPDLVINQPESLLQNMDDWNTKHHSRSGLVDLVRQSDITTEEAEERTLEVVSLHCPRGKIPLAGNSIHTDRLFLARYMPRLNSWLHYRNVDVSTVKELAWRWFPRSYGGRPKKHGEHRALGDILDSIEELRYYRSAIFQAGK